jgi:hypothetical protein
VWDAGSVAELGLLEGHTDEVWARVPAGRGPDLLGA